MTRFLSEQTVQKSRARARCSTLVFRGLALLIPAALTAFCLLTRTGNARFLFPAAAVFTLLTGWAAIAVWLFRTEPDRAEASHLAGLMQAEKSEKEGRFFLSGDSFRIPKSVRVRKVRLETEEGTLSLNWNERLLSEAPADGTRVRVETARKFITGVEILEPAAKAEPRKALSRWKKVLGALGRWFPPAVLWAMLALIGVGFLFNRITETDPAHKITIYADCEVRDAADLAERLEKELDGAIRMVKVHPFTYALFGTDGLKSADLFILPDSHRAEYADWFLDGDGTLIFDPASGFSAGEDWFLYTPEGAEPEPYRILTGRNSPHLEDGLAERTAALLLTLKTTKEASP